MPFFATVVALQLHLRMLSPEHDIPEPFLLTVTFGNHSIEYEVGTSQNAAIRKLLHISVCSLHLHLISPSSCQPVAEGFLL